MSRQADSDQPKARQMVEGPEAFQRFDGAIDQLLSISHDELKRREKQYKEQAALNPRKRGPKPKRKS